MFTGAFVPDFPKGGSGLFKAFGKLVLAIFLMPCGESEHGGVTNGSIASATAKISGKLVIKLVGGSDVTTIVALEKREDKSGGAVAAL